MIARQLKEAVTIQGLRDDLETSAQIGSVLSHNIKITEVSILQCTKEMLEAIAWFYNGLMLENPHLSMNEDSIIQVFANMIENLKELFENENVLVANAHILTGMDPGPAYAVDDVGPRDDKATLLKTRIETWFVRVQKNVKMSNVSIH